MRWKTLKVPDPTTRVVTKFLWFPRQINKEYRWLEIAKISQGWYRGWGWIDVEWVDE